VLRPVDAIIPAAAFRDTQPPRRARRKRGRWLVLGFATLMSCAVAYTAFSVVQKLDPRVVAPSRAASPSVEAAFGEVLDDVQAKLERFISRAFKPVSPPPPMAAQRGAHAPEREVKTE
jgi:hypothetical protein